MTTLQPAAVDERTNRGRPDIAYLADVKSIRFAVDNLRYGGQPQWIAALAPDAR
jgi:hypothetical protein